MSISNLDVFFSGALFLALILKKTWNSSAICITMERKLRKKYSFGKSVCSRTCFAKFPSNFHIYFFKLMQFLPAGHAKKLCFQFFSSKTWYLELKKLSKNQSNLIFNQNWLNFVHFYQLQFFYFIPKLAQLIKYSKQPQF